jgi:hypothetical protein
MSTSRWTAVVVAAALCGPAALAKPPELPLDPTVSCREAPAGLTPVAAEELEPPIATPCPFTARPMPCPVEACETDGPADNVLDNLHKLTRAAALYRKAEAAHAAGDWAAATAGYARVMAACPGSRYDRMAAARLREVVARADADSTGEESEPLAVGAPGCRVEVEISGGRVRVWIDGGDAAATARVLGECLRDWAATLGGSPASAD